MESKVLQLTVVTVFILLTSVRGFAQQTADAYLKRGQDLLEQKNYLQAQESFEKAVELNPNFAEAYYFRGRVQLDDAKADADFTKAIALKPNYAEAYFQRGLNSDMQNNRVAAMNDYNQAIELNPNFIDAYMTRAWLYRLDQKYKLAIADYTKVIKLKPNGDSYYVRGNTYLEMGEYSKAIADLTQSIQLDPTYYWAYKQRARAYRNLKKFRLAEADERKAAAVGAPRVAP